MPVHPTMSTSNEMDSAMKNSWNSSLVSFEAMHPKPQLTRTLFSVIWSCILTVCVCAWTSVHPNVPPRSQWGGLWASVRLTFWMVVAPEFMLIWAVRQWSAAKEVRDIYNARKGKELWTKEHGHFLIMGGYQLVNEDFDKYEERDMPGMIATIEDWDNYNAYQKQREKSQLGVLTVQHFRELIRDPNFKFPRITAAQIKDRSKKEGLSKIIAMLPSWFIVQGIARGLQGLAFTELELVTLAMALVNTISLAFWWSKPLGVQEPVNVYVPGLARGEVVRTRVEEGHDDLVTSGNVIGNTWIQLKGAARFIFDPLRYRQKHELVYALGLYLVGLPYRIFFVLTYPVFVLFPIGISFLLWVIKTKKVETPPGDETVATRVLLSFRMLRYKVIHSIRRYFQSSLCITQEYFKPRFVQIWFIVTPINFVLLVLLLIELCPLFIIFVIASFNFTAIFEIATTYTVPPRSMHVPSFYSPITMNDRFSRLVVFLFFGTTFGAIHCIGWNFIFPTHYERSIWRYSSAILVVTPLVVAPIDYILENVALDGRFSRKLLLVLDIFMTSLLFVYVAARLSLIAQAFFLLRDQPPVALVAVDWTKYIPHFLN